MNYSIKQNRLSDSERHASLTHATVQPVLWFRSPNKVTGPYNCTLIVITTANKQLKIHSGDAQMWHFKCLAQTPRIARIVAYKMKAKITHAKVKRDTWLSTIEKTKAKEK